MSRDEEKKLSDLLRELHKKTEDQHKIFTDSIREINQKLDSQTAQLEELKPVAEVYQSFSGAGKLMKGFLTWIVFPSSAVIGLYFGIKNLFK